ncbi:hypothetical protein TSUD_423840, partial [Trifolium subterraneum]
YVDFVFGNGRSLYEGNTLKSIAENVGYITAQSRSSLLSETGFSITKSRVIGGGQVYLGRPWDTFSIVIFSYTSMENIVLPQEWDDTMGKDYQLTTYYGEYKCSGPGFSFSARAPWVRS